MPAETPKKAFDASGIIRQILLFEGYLRLIGILIALGLCLSVAYYVFARPVYQSRALIRVNTLKASVDNTGEMATEVDEWLVVKGFLQTLQTPVLLVRSVQRLGEAGPNASYEGVRDSLVPKLVVNYIGDNILELELYSYNPRIVRELPEAMIEQFREDRIQDARTAWELSLDRYATELENLRSKLEQKVAKDLRQDEENDLARTQMRHRQLSNVPIDLEVATFKLGEIERVLQTLERESAKGALDTLGQLSLIQGYRSSKSLEVGDTVGLPTPALPTEAAGQPVPTSKPNTMVVIQPEAVDPLTPWVELEREKRKIERELTESKSLYLPGHPKMEDLNSRLRVTTDRLTGELETAKRQLVMERESLKAEVAALEKRMPEYFAATEELSKKNLNAKLAESGELDWSKMYEQIAKEVTKARSATNHEAVILHMDGFINLRDQDPISPNKGKLVTMGLLLSLGLGLGVPFGLQMMKTSSSTLTELENVTGIPGIGLIPKAEPEELEHVARSPRIGAVVPNYLLENFRLIRSNLILHPGRTGKAQVIMVTSARPSEGKTTAAVNLAWSFYSMGETTLLLDCDLRRGRVHRVLDLDNEKGLTTLFAGQSTESEVILDTEVDNLWVIPRGPIIPGTTEKLCGQEFASLLTHWRTQYSRIVIDTPPVLGLSESSSLQRVVDGVVLLVQAEKTSRKDILDALGILRKSGAHLFGFVLNRVDLKKLHNYYNYYHYSSHYYDSIVESEEDKKPRQRQLHA
ncbi:MAG: polysaccharide biosynthesis tyrosine autokinase [Verrucomicrobia bacterium]|nr:polysaccharide biosynthesis tyrosine autokinase [Verrucomicrobiota bacterium]